MLKASVISSAAKEDRLDPPSIQQSPPIVVIFL